jgi:hypothetical protein
VPELDGHGHAKIVPMAKPKATASLPGAIRVVCPSVPATARSSGTISDMWVDAPEQLVRYLEIELDAEHGGGKRLVPIHFCRIWGKRVKINAIYGKHFAGVPVTKSPTQVTLLEEEKISAYYGGGTLYADQSRIGSIRCSDALISDPVAPDPRPEPGRNDRCHMTTTTILQQNRFGACPRRCQRAKHPLAGAARLVALAKEALSFWWVAGYFVFLFAVADRRRCRDRNLGRKRDGRVVLLWFWARSCAFCCSWSPSCRPRRPSTPSPIKRVAMRIGAALTMTLNLPFRQTEERRPCAAPGWQRTIALELMEDGHALSYLMTWPHVRPWKMKRTQPALALHPGCARGRDASCSEPPKRRFLSPSLNARARSRARRCPRSETMADTTRHYTREEQKLVTRDKEMVPSILVRAMFLLCLSVLIIVTYAR